MSILLLLAISFPLSGMQPNEAQQILTSHNLARINEDCDENEPAILDLIRQNPQSLFTERNFNDVAMITRKSFTPQKEETHGSLTFIILPDMSERGVNKIISCSAFHKTASDRIQVVVLATQEKYLKKGYATGLLYATIQYIRATSAATDIWARIAKDNKAAIRVWQKVAGKIPHATLHWQEGMDKDPFIVTLK